MIRAERQVKNGGFLKRFTSAGFSALWMGRKSAKRNSPYHIMLASGEPFDMV
jgi:hypothetical protein